MMKNCKDIENKLSSYIDNVLSAEDKRMVEEHLKACAKCSAVLADLQKVKAVTNKLSEVEPPEWFKQKIMAQVRAEAEKKSFVEKWFYPLRVKVPVQVFATIFIVVVAVYIYRAGNEQFKEVIPPAATAPMMEEKQDELAAKQDVSAAVAARPSKKITEAEKSCEGNACEVSEIKTYDSAEDFAASAKGKSEAPASPAPVQAKDKEVTVSTLETKSQTMRASMEKSVSAVRLKQDNKVIIIRTFNVQSAVTQVEKILAEYSAAKVSRQSTEAKVIFRAEISKDKLKDFIEKLKTIGKVEEKGLPAISTESYIPVVIEIQDQ
jgi:uncharacterized protein YqkB